MAHLLSKTLLAIGISLAATTLCAAPAFATETKSVAKAKPKAKKAAATEDGAIHPTTPEDEPDVADTKVVQFNCELGAVVTTYTNANDKDSLAIRWKKRLHRLFRVGTTTGAHRFENKNFGLIWIGIPSKGMLLDSRQNRQLANECKSAEQEAFVPQAPMATPGPAPIGATLAQPHVNDALVPAVQTEQKKQ